MQTLGWSEDGEGKQCVKKERLRVCQTRGRVEPAPPPPTDDPESLVRPTKGNPQTGTRRWACRTSKMRSKLTWQSDWQQFFFLSPVWRTKDMGEYKKTKTKTKQKKKNPELCNQQNEHLRERASRTREAPTLRASVQTVSPVWFVKPVNHEVLYREENLGWGRVQNQRWGERLLP